jgi:hypothetical protein
VEAGGVETARRPLPPRPAEEERQPGEEAPSAARGLHRATGVSTLPNEPCAQHRGASAAVTFVNAGEGALRRPLEAPRSASELDTGADAGVADPAAAPRSSRGYRRDSCRCASDHGGIGRTGMRW